MKCKNVVLRHGIPTNCGKCMACRVNDTSQWTVRCLFELNDWESASFVTLTYNNENLPSDFSLKREHLDTFIDDVTYDLKVQGRKFKYMACGEYGDDTTNSPPGIQHGRPHYHLIMFGLNPDPSDMNNDRHIIVDNWKRCEPWMFNWKRKDNAIDFVNREDIRYVCGYVQKKLNGKLGKDIYGDRLPPFRSVSQGLGLKYAEKFRDRLASLGYVMLNGKKIAIPRYFRRKLDIQQSELVKYPRKEDIHDSVEFMYGLFVQDMKKAGFWRPALYDSPENLERRFRYWYDDHMYDISERVEKDFLQRRKMFGGKF